MKEIIYNVGILLLLGEGGWGDRIEVAMFWVWVWGMG
jgi:hypothetical protein